MRGSQLAVAAAAVVGVCSLGVAAFALDGTGDTGSVADPTVTTEAPVTTVAPAEGSTDGAVADPAVGDTPTADAPSGVSTVDCPEGQTYANHGAYVSSVAHDPNRAPGDVQQAAQSECGKPLTSTELPDTTDPETTEPPATDAPSSPASTPSAPGNSGNAPGHNK